MTPFLFDRLVVALEGTPDVLDGLLGRYSLNDSVWDYRPDPDRFTIREIVAHLTDLELIWMDRFMRTNEATQTVFERVDSSQLVIDNNYAASNPQVNCKLFRTRREELVKFMRTLTVADWSKISIVGGPLGAVTLEFQAGFIAIHDGYHTGQIAQWILKRS